MRIYFILTLLIFSFNSIVMSQVTIGSGTPPQSFSILEIDATATKGGLRLPQLLSSERDGISITGNTTTAPGLMIYNYTDNVLEYWNGTTWIRPSGAEPFQVSGTTNAATSNTQNVYQMGNVGIGLSSATTNKLHVSAASNPLRLEGLVSGLSTDSLLSADATGVVKRRSVQALRKDIVSTTGTPFEGMIKYDTATKTMQYYDGTAWQIVASNALFTKNEGIVRINSGATGSATNFTNTTANTTYNVTYAFPLTYGIAAWPENITNPTGANIYNTSNNRFLENSIVNQTHIWRITLSYTKGNNILSQQIDVSLFNPISSFRVTGVGTIASGRTAGSITLYLITVADSNSIGNGYQLQWSCSDTLTRLTIDNVTRISNYKD